jgi:hypothetical protein
LELTLTDLEALAVRPAASVTVTFTEKEAEPRAR